MYVRTYTKNVVFEIFKISLFGYFPKTPSSLLKDQIKSISYKTVLKSSLQIAFKCIYEISLEVLKT